MISPNPPRSRTTPRSRTEKQLRQHLQGLCESYHFEGPLAARYAYRCPVDYVLQHGSFFTPQPLRPDVPPGLPKYCYHNAQRLTRASAGRLWYVEGYAFTAIICPHAWCVDGDGRVIDPTWAAHAWGVGTAYFGVVFDSAQMRKFRGRRTSIPQNWEDGDPILQTSRGLQSGRWTKPRRASAVDR